MTHIKDKINGLVGFCVFVLQNFMVLIYCLEIFRFRFKILRDISVILMHNYLPFVIYEFRCYLDGECKEICELCKEDCCDVDVLKGAVCK